MPLYDVIHKDGRKEEVFVHNRKELDRMNVTLDVQRIHVGGKPTEEPFAKKIMHGYYRAEEKGERRAWGVNAIKRTWGN